jgi:hypothetical protein
MLRTFRTLLLLFLCLGSASAAFAFSRKNACTVRFHVEVEGSVSSSDPFARPVRLTNPPRQIFVESSAALSERQVASVYVFPTADGTWGALFQLDTSGRKILAQISSSKRGRSFVAFVGNHKLARQLPEDILIDAIILDGMLPIPKGLSYSEVLLLQKHFKALAPAAKSFSSTP